MANFNIFVIVLSFQIILLLEQSECNSVTIKNFASKLISCQCSSKDDKLEYKNLDLTQEYSFQFRPNLWGNTLFWCTVSYFTEDKSFVAFGYNRKEFDNTYVIDSTGIVYYNSNEYLHFWTKHPLK